MDSLLDSLLEHQPTHKENNWWVVISYRFWSHGQALPTEQENILCQIEVDKLLELFAFQQNIVDMSSQIWKWKTINDDVKSMDTVTQQHYWHMNDISDDHIHQVAPVLVIESCNKDK